jgi:predicted transcriptional regulator
MEQPPPDVPDAELAVLQVLWELGSAPIRRIADRLYADADDNYYATVQKLLERLERKGYVARDRSGHAHLFRATLDRDTLVGRRLRAVAEKLCGGMMTPLLTHLVRAETLSDAERQELRALIDELDRKGKPGR